MVEFEDDLVPVDEMDEVKKGIKEQEEEFKKEELEEKVEIKKQEEIIDYKTSRNKDDNFINAAKTLEEDNKINVLLFEGTLEEEYPIFNKKMKVRIRTLTMGEKIKVALETERTGSLLGQESYDLIAVVETLARGIISLNGEQIFTGIKDEYSKEEIYEIQRKEILKWSDKTLNEIFKEAWIKLLEKEKEYIELLKKES